MKFIQASNLLVVLFIIACAKTPDPNYLPVNLGDDKEPPWETNIYSVDELSGYFPDSNYTNLISYYVSSTGNDETGDGSATKPYNTVQHAIDLRAAKGIIIRVNPAWLSRLKKHLNMV